MLTGDPAQWITSIGQRRTNNSQLKDGLLLPIAAELDGNALCWLDIRIFCDENQFFAIIQVFSVLFTGQQYSLDYRSIIYIKKSHHIYCGRSTRLLLENTIDYGTAGRYRPVNLHTQYSFLVLIE